MPATTSPAATVAQIRAEFAKVRTMKRNLRLGMYEGRNNGGNYDYALDRAEKAARDLPRALEGALWAEHRLALRISENRDAGQDRPELRARLAATRKSIRDMTPAA